MHPGYHPVPRTQDVEALRGIRRRDLQAQVKASWAVGWVGSGDGMRRQASMCVRLPTDALALVPMRTSAHTCAYNRTWT